MNTTWECCLCRETYISKTSGLCHLCGQPLTQREPGAVPFGRELEDDDLAVTADDDVVLVRRA